MSSPSTPRHSRNSTMDLSMASSPNDRRHSRSSFNEPSTPTHHLHPSFGHGDNTEMFNSSGIGEEIGGGGGGGLGNLADELADALSDGDDDEYDYEDGIVGGEDLDGDSSLQHHNGPPPDISLSEVGVDRKGLDDGNGQRDSGVDVASTSSPRRDGSGTNGGQPADAIRNFSLNPPTTNGGRGGRHGKHNRNDSVYDGSEYGSDSDLDSPGMSPGLVAKIDAVESLARRGTEDNGGPTDGVCKRLTEELRDLGSQSNVEGGASRLITAHSALTTHLAHQTRQLHTLAFPLFSPLAMLPFAAHIGVLDDEASDDEDKEDVLAMMTALAEQIPRPSTVAYQSLTALHTLTSDLVSTLNYLSDTLHMARQTTTTATRRLRSAKELVADLRRDEVLREEGEEWLARGNWNERLQRRECAMVCGDVVGGFEEVCNGWRARLLAQAEAAQATA